MRNLRIEDLLRYGFAGGLGFIAFWLTYYSASRSFPDLPGIGETSLAIGAMFLAGSLVYVLHRAIVYPILYRLALILLAILRVFVFDWHMMIPYRQVNLEIEMDRWRMSLRKNDDTLFGHLAEWGAQVHFLYCSSLSILFGLGIGQITTCSADSKSFRMFVALSLILGVGGLVHHMRLLYQIKQFWRR